MILFFLILSGLVRLLMATGRPMICAGLLTAFHAVTRLIFLHSWIGLLLSTAVFLAGSSLYFWLLDRVETGSLLWWLLAIAGILPLYAASNWSGAF